MCAILWSNYYTNWMLTWNSFSAVQSYVSVGSHTPPEGLVRAKKFFITFDTNFERYLPRGTIIDGSRKCRIGAFCKIAKKIRWNAKKNLDIPWLFTPRWPVPPSLSRFLDPHASLSVMLVTHWLSSSVSSLSHVRSCPAQLLFCCYIQLQLLIASWLFVHFHTSFIHSHGQKSAEADFETMGNIYYLTKWYLKNT